MNAAYLLDPVFAPEIEDDDDADCYMGDDPFHVTSGLFEINEADDDPEESEDAGDVAPDSHQTPGIDEGDFLDPAQHFLFVRLKQHIRDACNVNSKPAVRVKALEWVFLPGESDSKGLDFDRTCLALGARPDVMRTRTAHQLWKANILLSAPLPFLAHPPPLALMSEIATVLGHDAPGKIAREVWYWPSIPVLDLRQRFSHVTSEKYRATLDGLTAEGYLAISAGRVYFVGRNPSLLPKAARERFAFSNSIVTD